MIFHPLFKYHDGHQSARGLVGVAATLLFRESSVISMIWSITVTSELVIVHCCGMLLHVMYAILRSRSDRALLKSFASMPDLNVHALAVNYAFRSCCYFQSRNDSICYCDSANDNNYHCERMNDGNCYCA